MIDIWHITPTQNTKLDIDATTLDAATRQLPAPDGYYSTFRTFAGSACVLGLTAHLKRLYEPISSLDVDEARLRQVLRTLLAPYHPGEARVRLVMTRLGQLYIAIAPFTPLPRDLYEKGVGAETTLLERQHPRLKSTSFIDRSDAERKHIAETGIFEALLVKDGNILEGMTSNFFYVPHTQRDAAETKWEAMICTARDGILLGITRETVLEIARGMGLKVRYQPLKRDQLGTVRETFITSSSRGIVPVIQIDNVRIGQGIPGPITKQLSAAYEGFVSEKAERI